MFAGTHAHLARKGFLLAAASLVLALANPVAAQDVVKPAPDRGPDEGDGPYDRLILRGAIVIDGTGAPPRGPVDIVIEGNRIARIVGVGVPGVPIDPEGRPEPGTKEYDVTGMYVLPGVVDCTSIPAASRRRPRPSTSTSCGWHTGSPPGAASPLDPWTGR